MTDKERILTYILTRIQSGQLLCKTNGPYYDSDKYRKIGGDDGYYPHFAPWKDPEAGDLIICQTSGIHECTVGIVKDLSTDSEATIKELGSERAMSVSNEKFIPILGIDITSEVFFFGEQLNFLIKVKKAFKRGDEYLYRYRSITFDGDTATIVIGPHAWIHEGNEPFSVSIPWDKKTTIKFILQKMIEAGYRTKFSKKNKKGERLANNPT